VNPWYAKGVVIAATVVMVAIRAPHGQRSRSVPVARNAKGLIETVLLTVAWMSFFVPIVWIASGAFKFAEFELRPVPLVAGAVLLAVSLWLFHRSHADLGTNWSITLQVREGHTLVTRGVYARIRHPMYSSLLLYAAGQAVAVPNWVAGPSYIAALSLLVLFRLGPEERMMRERFGAEWDAYAARTKRLVPGVW
jgi:protein-S-isoprenylcysteine O-methyltransferase Ste14